MKGIPNGAIEPPGTLAQAVADFEGKLEHLTDPPGRCEEGIG
jgi:hypothetical protein